MAFDRFLAVTFPLKYNSFVTYKVSLVMITISWLPSVTAGVLDAIKFLLGTNKVNALGGKNFVAKKTIPKYFVRKFRQLLTKLFVCEKFRPIFVKF